MDTTGTACPGASWDDAKRRGGPSLKGKINRPVAQVAHGFNNVDEVGASRCQCTCCLMFMAFGLRSSDARWLVNGP